MELWHIPIYEKLKNIGYFDKEKSTKTRLNMNFKKGKIELSYQDFAEMLFFLKEEFQLFYQIKFYPEIGDKGIKDVPHWILVNLINEYHCEYDFCENKTFIKFKNLEIFFKAFEEYTENFIFIHNLKIAITDDEQKEEEELFFEWTLKFMEDWFIPVNQGYK